MVVVDGAHSGDDVALGGRPSKVLIVVIYPSTGFAVLEAKITFSNATAREDPSPKQGGVFKGKRN